jgi:hypothetical protein
MLGSAVRLNSYSTEVIDISSQASGNWGFDRCPAELQNIPKSCGVYVLYQPPLGDNSRSQPCR